MKTVLKRALVGGTSLALSATMAASLSHTASAAPDRGAEQAQEKRRDNFPHPLGTKQQELRKQAIAKLAAGKASPKAQPGGGSVMKVDGEAVEFFDNDKQANIWTVLSEFGSESSGRYGRGSGPLHNEMPVPDRAVDNTTQWTDDFNVEHYDRMFNATEGESFRNYYLEQSNGQYTATTTVEDWVKVPKNGAWYGDNSNETAGYWGFIADTVNAWYDAQVAAGKSAADISAYLAQFDKWDRYDFDGDTNFNEADGYIDHFQAVHAGAGEEAGGGVLGEDAIWSHRWYAYYTDAGTTGPTAVTQSDGDVEDNLLGGARIGDTNFFVGDYTVEPENGGLGVFAHEYGHDLGLPDFYDTAGGENGTGFWTLMSSGSWMGHGSEATGFQTGIGGTPNNMGPEERLFLGWLNHQVVEPGTSGSYEIDASGSHGDTQALLVPLPDSSSTTELTTPYAGSGAWYSGTSNNRNSTLTRTVPAADRVTISARVWHQIEAGYDYLFAEYSTDGGQSWSRIGQGIDGASNGWESMRFAYRAGGAESLFRFRYVSDGGVNEPGALVDEVVGKDGRTVLFTDGAESGDNGWTADGWGISDGTVTSTGTQYYLIENRGYVAYDDTLRTGPYNFSETATRPDWVEHFSYQDGMLVWMVNHGQADNNTSTHPGEGYALPVDATPAPIRWSGGSVARNRIQSFDATFGLQPTDETTWHRNAESATAPSHPGVPTFDDSDPLAYWSADNPTNSVKVAGAGVTATVTGERRGALLVQVSNQLP